MSKTIKIKTARKHRWSQKYKNSINCRRPRGFSQRQYCKYGRNQKIGKKQNTITIQ